MSACENPNGSCAMRTGFLASCQRRRSMEPLVIPGHESCLSGGAEKNGLWSLWLGVLQLLRPTALGGARSVVWPDANLLGVGNAPSGLPKVPSGEGRTLGMAGGQSVLHQTVCLSCRTALPRLDHHRGGRRTPFGLEDGQGVGPAVYARAVAPGRVSSAVGDWHRRSVHPQRTYLPDRGERFAASAAHLVWRQGPFGSQPGGILHLAGGEEMRPDSIGRHGYVEAVPDRNRSPCAQCGDPLRQVPHHAPLGRGSGSRP